MRAVLIIGLSIFLSACADPCASRLSDAKAYNLCQTANYAVLHTTDALYLK